MMLNVIEYLETTAKKKPDKLAFADDKNGFTFSQLLENAQRIGTAAAELAGGCNRPIPVLVERSADTIAAFMGVILSGNYYVPLDSKMPEKRLRRILEQLDPPFIISQPENEKKAAGFAEFYDIISLNQLKEKAAEADMLKKLRERVLDIDPAYLIFTSGSTGEPKGIVISHRSVIDFVDWMAQECDISSDDVMANQAPFSFDLSVKDIYLTLKCGGTCHILAKKYFMLPKMLLEQIAEKKATALIWATSAFNLAANSGALGTVDMPYLKKIIVGGEALRAKQLNIWRKFLPEVKYTNLYGPTEVTVDCTYYHINRQFNDDEIIPIGYPCRNKEILLLDNELRPVAAGQPGEICVRGIGLAQGYYGNPEKTAQAFVINPNNPAYPQRIYRTGDIAYRNEEGLLIYLSREDGQIKHMGYRIELGEVENAVNSLEGVASAIVFFDDKKDKIVCIYEGDASWEKFAAELRKILPKYMMPNVFKHMERLPVNLNGKIDRPQLKEGYFNEKSN